MPQIVSALDLINSGEKGGFERYARLGMDMRAQRKGEEADARNEERFQADFDRASSEYARAEQARGASQEYDLAQLEQSGGVQEAQILQRGQQATQAAASRGMFGAPYIAAIGAIVPQEIDRVHQETSRLAGIAERMSEPARKDLVARYEAQTVDRLRQAAGQKVMAKMQTMMERGQLGLEGDEPGEDGAMPGMGGRVQATLMQIQQGLESGELDPVDANMALTQIQDEIVAENGRRAFVEQGFLRIDRELAAAEPTSQDAEELALIRAGWQAGKYETGDDLEDAIFEARTGRKTARAIEPKTPQEQYENLAMALLKVDPKMTQEGIDAVYQIVSAGPQAQRPQPEAPPKKPASPYRNPAGAVGEAYAKAKTNGTSRGTSVAEVSPKAAPKATPAASEPATRVAEEKPAGDDGTKGGKRDVVDWHEASKVKRAQAKQKIRELLAKPGGDVMDIPNALRAMGLRLGSIPKEELAALKEELKKKAEEKLAPRKKKAKEQREAREKRGEMPGRMQ